MEQRGNSRHQRLTNLADAGHLCFVERVKLDGQARRLTAPHDALANARPLSESGRKLVHSQLAIVTTNRFKVHDNGLTTDARATARSRSLGVVYTSTYESISGLSPATRPDGTRSPTNLDPASPSPLGIREWRINVR